MSDFGKFITQDVMDTTIEAWSRDKGKHITYLTASALDIAAGSFGKISPNHSFLKEPSFDNIHVLLVKSNFHSHEDHLNVFKTSTTVSTLWTHIVQFKSLDF